MESKPKVALFVDYENLFYSMYNKYQAQPCPMELIRLAQKYGQIYGARAYGDFEKNVHIKGEVPKLRAASFEVVHTRTELVGCKEKSYTDFKILEDLFVLREESKDLKMLILATGDGHFSNIVARMRIRDGMNVIVVGVKGTISRELQMAAGKDFVIEISGKEPEVDALELKKFVVAQEERYRYLTFIRTAHAYLENINVPVEQRDYYQRKIIVALNKLIDDGHLEQCKILRNGVPVNIIRVAGDGGVKALG